MADGELPAGNGCEGVEAVAEENEKGRTALHRAAEDNQKELAMMLITKGAKVNAQAEQWARTPLDAAIS